MEEPRPDVPTDGPSVTEMQKADKSLAVPGEPLDDRDLQPSEFQVDEELSSTNTDFGGKDPAL